MAADNSIEGFKAVRVKYAQESSVLRWLFIKQHLVRDKIPEKPTDRTLFVINVPPYCNELSLMETFSVCGPVSNVYCHTRPCPFLPPQNSSKFFPEHRLPFTHKVAYVVFEEAESLLKALKLDKASPPLILASKDLKTGLLKWAEDYNKNIINPEELQQDIDKFMAKFDEEEKQRDHEAKMAGEPDEEGWTTVTKKSRNKGIVRTAVVRQKILEKEKLKRSQKELKNFYRFQIRESKMKHLEKLRQKFEEDKKKINAFKQSRKFKPF